MRPITKKQYGESFKSWKIMYTHVGGIIDTIPSGGKVIIHIVMILAYKTTI